jgi:homoserine O-acetyltransferase/O-succinyltransferase
MKNILKKSNYTEGVTIMTELNTQLASNPKIFHDKTPFSLECGVVLPEIDIAYHTYGTLNAAKDNAVWVFHALTGNSDAADWWGGMIGEGKFLDPKAQFIICANMLGSHYGSTSPLSINPKTGTYYGRSFPMITIRDVVNGHIRLSQHLGIQKVRLGIGGSMGGQQVLEWAIMQPDFFENIAVIACGVKMTPWSIALNETQRMAIEADQTISEENLAKATTYEAFLYAGAKGMEAARAIGMLSYRSYEGYNIAQADDSDLLDTFKVQSYQRYQANKLRKRFNALSYLSLSKTMDSHNVGRGRGGLHKALSRVKCNTLVVGIQTDILFPLEEQVKITSYIPQAKIKLIDSKFGHDGFLIEFDQMLDLLEKFMKKKKAVRKTHYVM